MKRARAVHRGYWTGGRQAGQVRRLHIIRDTPIRRHQWPSSYIDLDGFEYTWCGQSAGVHRHSDPLVIDPMPARPPDGLTWCPKCVGHLAEHYGLLAEIAASLAAYDPGIAAQ